MKLFEYQAKDLFKKNGIPVPKSRLAKTAEEAEKLAAEMNIPLALKSQVLVGGRGKAGGIKFADNPSQVKELVQDLLKLEIKGERVDSILLEEKLNIESNSMLVWSWIAQLKSPDNGQHSGRYGHRAGRQGNS